MKKNKNVAILLAFFGGIFGLHKFYLRDIGGGIFYLFFFIFISGIIKFPVTVILGIIDAINMLGMSEEKFDSKYNKNVRGFQQRRTTRDTRTSRASTRRQSREDIARDRRKADRSRYQVNKTPKRQRSNPFKKTAYAKYKDYDLEEAIVDYKQALEIAPEDKEIHFYMAAVYSMLEKKDKSFFHLDKSVQFGLKQTGKILEMDEFAYLRVQKEFEDFKSNHFRIVTESKTTSPNEELVMDDLLLARLNKLKEMRERGLLSENEFLLEKQKIIRQ
jgi:TM2 domain-containing membrane protein YozV